MKIEFVKTNIVNISADAIVLPANTKLKEGRGTSTAIFEAAGRKQLTKACDKIGFCEVGSAVPTLAFNLDAKYIIHAVVPVWIDGQSNEYARLSSAYLSALNVADIMGCESIAFPMLAAGNNGFSIELALKIAEESIESFNSTKLNKVTLVLHGDSITDIVKNQGYKVPEIPFELKKERDKLEHKAKIKKMALEGKEIAQKFTEDQIQKGLDLLKIKENREKILAVGIEIAKIVINIK